MMEESPYQQSGPSFAKDLANRLALLGERVQRGEFRCARGFLAAVQTETGGQGIGLLLKRGLKQPVRERYHVSAYGEHLEPPQAKEIDEAIVHTMADIRRRIGKGQEGAWQQRWCRSLFVTTSEAVCQQLDKATKSLGLTGQAHPRQDRSNLFRYSKRLTTTESSYDASTVTSNRRRVPLFIQRIWPAQGWNLEKGVSAWIYVIDPCNCFKPDAQEDSLAIIESQLSEFISFWFDSKASVLHTRRWIKGLEAQDHDDDRSECGDDRPRGSVAAYLQKLYGQTLVLPVSSSDFCNFLPDLVNKDAFATAKQVSECFKNGLLAIANMIVGDAGGDGHRCKQCPQKGCPQLSWDSKAIQAIARLQLWDGGFLPFLGGEEIVSREMVQWAVDGLKQAIVLLDADSEKPMDFGPESKPKLPVLLDRLPDQRERRRAERKLLRFWLARAIDESIAKLSASWESHALQRQMLEYPAALGRLAIVLLGDQPWTAARINDLIAALAGYAQEVLGVPWRIDLAAHLGQTLRGETALHTLKGTSGNHITPSGAFVSVKDAACKEA